MKRIIYILLLLFAISCKPQHQVIVEHVTQTHYVDSLVIKDSVVTVPIERYVDLVREYDTLKLSTSLASAEAWLDTANSCLKGSIWNKQTYTYEKEIVDHYITKDSIVDRPQPYPVEVMVEKPLNRSLLVGFIISSLVALGALCWIFRKQLMKLISLI